MFSGTVNPCDERTNAMRSSLQRTNPSTVAHGAPGRCGSEKRAPVSAVTPDSGRSIGLPRTKTEMP